MKKYKFKKISVEEKVLELVICNCCGKEIEKYHSHLEIEHMFGYYTNAFFDGETHIADICEACYSKWLKSFEIPPEGFGDGIRDFEDWKHK